MAETATRSEDGLTEEESRLLDLKVAECVALGRCTDPVDRPKIEAVFREIYECSGKGVPTVKWFDSPFSCAWRVGCNRFLEDLKDGKTPELRKKLERRFPNYADIVNESKIFDDIDGTIGAMDKTLGDEVVDAINTLTREALYEFSFGQHEVVWVLLYVFAEDHLGANYGPKISRHLRAWADAYHTGWWIPFETEVYACERPCEFHVDADGRISNPNGPSILFRDGHAVYTINGVRVPDWLANTPAEKLDPKRIHEITNAEVRAAFVRKVGIDRILHGLSPGPIDTDGEYELHLLDFGNRTTRPYLKMHNPSVPEIWHVEGVPPGTKTVREALAFRNGFKPTDIDDENGVEWFQQGDVLIKPIVPAGTKFKLKPKILT